MHLLDLLVPSVVPRQALHPHASNKIPGNAEPSYDISGTLNSLRSRQKGGHIAHRSKKAQVKYVY